MHRHLLSAGFALALAIAAPVSANAALYDFTYTVTGDFMGGSDYSGVFDVSGTTVTDITGSSSLYGSITGLIAPGGFAGNDNQLSLTEPYFDGGGISFTLAAGGNANFYLNGKGQYAEIANGAKTGSSGDFTLSPRVDVTVPEPASLSLLGVGVLGLAGARGASRGRSIRQTS